MLGVLAITAGLCSCSSPDKQIEDARKKISGLAATTQAVGEAWTQGDVSSRYARTAFEQTLQMLDEQRASLGTSPQVLLDPRGASLSREAEELSRALAALIQDAERQDSNAARQHLSRVPPQP